jgi:hypothetical protein
MCLRPTDLFFLARNRLIAVDREMKQSANNAECDTYAERAGPNQALGEDGKWTK